MKQRSIGLISVVLGMMILAPSAIAGTLVEFEGGIGVITADGIFACTPATGSTNCTVNRNVVRGVSPGGQPWVIRRFEAKVKENGDIRAEGKGLVLAGSDNIGTRGGVTMVAATLFCGSDVPHSTGGHPLAADGDFKIKDTLSPTPPDPCTSPVLLIRNFASPTPGTPPSPGAWFAAGILKLEHDD